MSLFDNNIITKDYLLGRGFTENEYLYTWNQDPIKEYIWSKVNDKGENIEYSYHLEKNFLCEQNTLIVWYDGSVELYRSIVTCPLELELLLAKDFPIKKFDTNHECI